MLLLRCLKYKIAGKRRIVNIKFIFQQLYSKRNEKKREKINFYAKAALKKFFGKNHAKSQFFLKFRLKGTKCKENKK